MYEFGEIKELHLELTERCNAACPMCARTTWDGKVNPYLKNQELSLEFLQSALPPSFLKQLDRIRFCGNFGDPAVAEDSLKIVEHMRSVSPNSALSFHTNGGVRERSWWHQLGRLFKSQGDEIVFALDGLKDTLSLYRRGVSFERAFENACSSIRAGGKVHWVMLVFEHNEHQVDEAREIALKYGFSSFRVKGTKRFIRDSNGELTNSWDVYDKKGEALYEIRLPSDPQYINPVISSLSTGSASEKIQIECHVQKRKSLYISAKGLVVPCCWIASSFYSQKASDKPDEISTLFSRTDEKYDSISLYHRSLEGIISDSLFQKQLPSLWAENKPRVCAKTCNKHRQSFQAQFIARYDFNR